MTVPRTFGARPVITVGGSPLPRTLEAHVLRVEVTSDAHAPDACRIVLSDPGRGALADLGADFHADVTVSAARTGERDEQPLFSGRVYSLSFDYDEQGAVTVIGAYDHSYALRNGLRTATYCNVTDADLARDLAGQAGLTAGDIHATSVVHEHISQVNETDWDFLVRRAHETDAEVRVVGDRLDFRTSTAASDAPEPGDFRATDRLQLTPGGNLERFTVRVTAAQQVTEVEVRGWDPQRKEELIATAPARSRGADARDRPDELAGGGDRRPRHLTVTPELRTQAACDAVAAAEAERLASSAVHAEGVARGDPRIVAGAAVSVGQSGGRFDGKYTVTHARHVFGRAGGYRTHFTAAGRQDRSVLGLVSGAANGAAGRGGPGGVLPAIVTNITDPDKAGRVKVRFPWLADDYESDWARVLQLGAGADRGLLLLPEVNDEVLVVFEHGDPRRPVVLGGLYNGVDTPPRDAGVDAAGGKVRHRVLRSRAGNELVMTDTEGGERVELRTPGGKTELVLDHGAGSVTVHADGDVQVDAKGNASVRTQGNLTVESGGRGTVRADAGLTLESRGTVTLKGSVIRLN